MLLAMQILPQVDLKVANLLLMLPFYLASGCATLPTQAQVDLGNFFN